MKLFGDKGMVLDGTVKGSSTSMTTSAAKSAGVSAMGAPEDAGRAIVTAILKGKLQERSARKAHASQLRRFDVLEDVPVSRRARGASAGTGGRARRSAVLTHAQQLALGGCGGMCL
jgi:hypothetical protein